MKFLKKIAPPIGIIVILLAATALRIVLPSIPYDSYILLTFRALIHIFSEEWFGSSWAVWDLMVVFIALCCAICLPAEGKYRKLQRFVVAPLVILLVSALVTPFVNATTQKAYDDYRAYQKQQYQEMVDTSHQEIRDFIEIADEAIWYSKNNYGSETEFPELVREIWAGNHMPHVTDTILIDYDSKTVGFAYHDISYFVLKRISLSDQFTTPAACNYTNTVILAEPGAELKLYFNYKNGEQNNGYDIVCIVLTMADGTVYGTNDLTDPETGRNYHLKLPTVDEVFVRIEDFLERKR